VLDHPATRAWCARHPRLDVARWRAGLTMEATDDDGVSLRLAIEHDPMEALRLGSYVGSCLQPGGACSYSAVAVVLDVNKQVVYARHPGGDVIARQIVAISEDDRLVCFWVYPTSVSPHLRRQFAAFDEALAQALELPIWRGEPEDYVIANILSRSWWDDSAWDLRIPSRNRD
jgi:hypothetical protein